LNDGRASYASQGLDKLSPSFSQRPGTKLQPLRILGIKSQSQNYVRAYAKVARFLKLNSFKFLS